MNRLPEYIRRPETDPNYRALKIIEATLKALRCLAGNTPKEDSGTVKIIGVVRKPELFDQYLDDKHLAAEVTANMIGELPGHVSVHYDHVQVDGFFTEIPPAAPFDASRDTDLYPENFEPLPTIVPGKSISA